MTTNHKNTESSVLFNIRNIMDLQAERTRREAEAQQRKQEAEEARRLEAALRAHAAKEQERHLAEHLRAEAAKIERERLLAEREAEIKARVEQETAEQLELLRQAYAEEPLVRPRPRWSAIAAYASVLIAVVALSVFGVVFSRDRHVDAARPSTGTAAVALADRAVPPAPRTVTEAASPTGDAIALNKPSAPSPTVVKPRPAKRVYKHVKRCRTKTVVVKRIKTRCHALSFDGCYKDITKQVKTCRTVRVRVR